MNYLIGLIITLFVIYFIGVAIIIHSHIKIATVKEKYKN